MSDDERNKMLDAIMEARRSIRSFKSEIPPKELVEQVIHAGLIAPFSGLAASGTDYRRFVVIPRDSQITPHIVEILKRRITVLYEQFEKRMKEDPFLQQHGQAFARTLEMQRWHGASGVGSAPYYIVVAERKGVPAVEHRSLAHCLQNMWLKATALGLGFRLLSVTAQMEEDGDFLVLLDVPYGEFALDGCLIGYPAITPTPVKRPQVNEVTRWL
jgi:nitroreductase